MEQAGLDVRCEFKCISIQSKHNSTHLTHTEKTLMSLPQEVVCLVVVCCSKLKKTQNKAQPKGAARISLPVTSATCFDCMLQKNRMFTWLAGCVTAITKTIQSTVPLAATPAYRHRPNVERVQEGRCFIHFSESLKFIYANQRRKNPQQLMNEQGFFF